jgi:hypothetical protein
MSLTTRLQDLGRQAYQRALDLKLGALEAAKARIDAEFGVRNSAVKRLVHQMFEHGPAHPLIRLQYRKFALALAPDGCDPADLDTALLLFHARWSLNIAEARNEDLSLFRRRDAEFRAARYRAMTIVLRYMRAHHVTPLRFEAIRQTVCHGPMHAFAIEGWSL